jgi:hypothetical protein
MMWRRRTRTIAAVGAVTPIDDRHEITDDVWSDIRTRARVVHSLACAGAGMSELTRLATNDPAVVMAAIVYDGGHPRDYSIIGRGEVVERLNDLLRTITWGCRAAGDPDFFGDDRRVGAAAAA